MHSLHSSYLLQLSSRRELRIWLVEQTTGSFGGTLAPWFQALTGDTAHPVLVIGKAPLRSDFVPALAKLIPELLDLIVLEPGCRPSSIQLESLLVRGAGVLAMLTPGETPEYLGLATRLPLTIMAPPPDPSTLQLALASAHAAAVRHQELVAEVSRLKQRLQDRVLLERAKVVLIRQMGLSEEDAYHWLRLLSRRERRPLRDVALALLETPEIVQQQADPTPLLPAGHRRVTGPA